MRGLIEDALGAVSLFVILGSALFIGAGLDPTMIP